MHTGLNCAHDLEGSFQNRQGCADRSLCRHIRYIHVAAVGKRAAFFYDVLEQGKKNLTWLFVRQGKNIVPNRARRYVYVSELSRLYWRVITLDAKTARLEAPG